MLYGSQRLISVRDGPNVRRTFDAVRVLTTFDGWRVDGFFARPVETDFGVFDDGGDADAQFWGIYGAGPLYDPAGMKLDLYYLGLDQPNAAFDQGTADELRHSIGARLFGKVASTDYNFEGVWQWGRFGDGSIGAWTLASDTGYTFEAAPTMPRIALRANVSSGDDDPNDDDLGTFNPLYPRGNYFGEAATLGPLNLVDLHPMLRFHFPKAVSLEAGWAWYWRYSTDDGIYGNGLNLIQGAAGSDERFIGSELSFVLEWQVNRYIVLSTSYSHLFAGAFLDDTGPGDDVDYFTVLASYRF
jgi:Alginate export